MSDPRNSHGEAPELEIRSADLDHWAEIRDLHASALRRLTGIEPSQCAALVARTREPEYTLMLQTQDLVAAWFDHQLVGSAGWVPFDARGLTARITSVCVSPLFTRLGVGRRLVEATEERAALAGYKNFAARVFPACEGFFEAVGYTRSSQGVQSLGPEGDLPVIFMRKGGARVCKTDSRPETVGASRGSVDR